MRATGSTLSLVTTMSKPKVPPGSGSSLTGAVLVRLIRGSTSVSSTSAEPSAVVTLSSSSSAVAVTMSVYGEDSAVPLTGAVKWHS